MSWLSRIFGGSGAVKSEPEAVEYKGFSIYPEPISEGGNFRISARIEKTVDGAEKVHQLIRSDTLNGLEVAVEASIGKAKQMIDEQGDRLFG